MATKPIFREINTDGQIFYGVMGAMATLVLAGLIAFFYVEHHGHYVTGMNNQVVWGMPHVFAIFLIVAASGAANIGSLGTVFNKTVYQPLGRLSLLLAMALLLGGLVILVLDLGHADRLIVAMIYYNFKSIFAWNILLYNGFLVIMAIYLWSMMDRSQQAAKFYKPMGYIAFVWRFILTTGTGSIFGFLVARQFYDAAILAPLFIAASYVFGTACFSLVLAFLCKISQRELGAEIQSRLRYTLAIFIVLVLFFELIRHLTNLYATEHHGVEMFILAGGSKITWLFWLVQIVLGSLLPLALLWLPALRHSLKALLIAAALAILGGLTQLYVIIIGGQLYPLVLFPNAEVSSTYFDGVITQYSASLPELALGAGGVALSLMLVFIAVKVLRIVPVSLSDADTSQ
ncbi:NrfD/PsrC family molybdoenzyme membrane anchor subunit [Leucothrix mucor]|uniref:NrfD/PsrC family molybdoenzyme membrane anchor subunit n=1 Tax=Leucothrix mucor TaxID=45248 RepID=UPI0003B4C3E1|nr:NrfD/PsrC family molybdoenzyme membrane anchor subunit [Leucothrix mucor]